MTENSSRIFDVVASRAITPEEGAEWAMARRYKQDYERLWRLYTLTMIVSVCALAFLGAFHGR